jgi:hypothetical protein
MLNLGLTVEIREIRYPASCANTRLLVFHAAAGGVGKSKLSRSDHND